MALLKPIWMQATGGDPVLQYSANELREFLHGLVRSEGVLDVPGGSLKVSQRGAGANFSVDVAAGSGVVFGDDVADQGMYMIRNTAAANFVVPAPPGSGTRVHRVVAQIRDKTHLGTWTTYDWTPVVLADTGAGTPAVPNSAIPLGRVSVTAGQASVLDANITHDRISAAILGGQPAQVSADAGRPPNPYVSEKIWRTDKKCHETWSGSAWREEYVAGEGPAWASYSPALTAATSNPVVGGTGSVVGFYQMTGKTVRFRVEITMGSGSTYGSGQYRVSIPFPAAASGLQYVRSTLKQANRWDGMGEIAASGTFAALITYIGSADGSLRTITNNQPVAWATGNTLNVYGTYEAA